MGDYILLRLARYSTALLLLVPLNATSLGLGDIQLRSALNEPLDARIGLNALGQTRVDDISVELASRDAFGQVGLDRPHFLSDLRFSVETDEQGRPTILVTSNQPISEPFLDFLVELNWPNGRLLREYTVLLDPPLLVDEAPAPIVAATTGGAGMRSASVPAAAPSARPSGSAAMTGARAQVAEDGTWNYGPVARDATLWSIAQELQALGGGYSIEQIMMALLQDNPEAFYNGNVNELKAGHVLRIEDPSTIGAISRAAAIAEHRRQTEQWMDAKRGVAGQVADRPMGAGGAAQVAADAAPVADGGPRLRLSAPEAIDAENLIGGTNEGEAEGADAQRLRQELAVALEISEAARQENVELRERLAALEEQIASMQRLLSLREDALTAMQAGAGAVSDQQPQSGATKSNPWTALLNDPMMLGAAGGGLLLFATLGWLIVRRRQAARAAIEEFAAQPAPRVRDEGSATTAATVAAGASAAAGLAVEEELVDEDEAALAGADGADIMQADEDEIDVLAEADVYLAYRRFDKAEELLKQAIQEDPQRNDLVFKLLEVYAASGDADAFALQAEALQAGLGEGDAGIWDKVVVMGRRVAPGHALFSAEAHSDAQADSAGVGELDLDNLDFTQFDEAAAAMSAADEAENPFVAAGDDVAAATDASTDAVVEDPSFAAVGRMAAESGPAATDGEDDADVASVDTGAGEFPLESGLGEPTAIDEERPGTLGDFAAMPASANEAGPEELADVGEGAGGMDIDWLSAVGDDLANLEIDLLAEDEDEYDGLVSGTDEVGTKLDLAKAYIDMGDQESALSILDEVGGDGSEDQQREVSALRSQIG